MKEKKTYPIHHLCLKFTKNLVFCFLIIFSFYFIFIRYIKIQLEDIKDYDAALKYMHKLPFQEVSCFLYQILVFVIICSFFMMK